MGDGEDDSTPLSELDQWVIEYCDTLAGGHISARLFAEQRVPDHLQAAFLALKQVKLLDSQKGEELPPSDPERTKVMVAANPAQADSGDVPLEDDFVWVRFVAKGGMGEVWLGHQRSLNRPVALKRPTEARYRDHLFEEATTQAMFDHPNIPKVIAVSRNSTNTFVASQFIDGRNLEDEVRVRDAERAADSTRHVRWEYFAWVANVGIAIASALDHVHSRLHRHGDMHTKNVMVNKEGVAFLIDFGLANGNGGKKGYIAPERRDGWATPPTLADLIKSDIYSLAVTLFNAAVPASPIRTPFDAPPSARANDPTVPRDLDAVLRKGMAFDPKDRYQTFKEFECDLNQLLIGRVPAARKGWAVRTWRTIRHNTSLFSGVALVVLTLVSTAVGYGVWTELDKDRELKARERVQIEQEQTAAFATLSLGMIAQSDPWAVKPNGASDTVTMTNDLSRRVEQIRVIVGWLDTRPNTRETRQWRSACAKWLFDLGRLSEASSAYDTNLSAWREAEGETHEETLRAAMTAASTGWSADEGRLDRSIRELERVADTVRVDPRFDDGPDRPNCEAALGAAYRQAKQYANALACYDRAVSGLQGRPQGVTDIETLKAKVFRAACVRDLARAESGAAKAVRLRREAGELEGVVAALRKEQSWSHPETLRAVSVLAGMYGELREVERAVSLYREQLEGLTVRLSLSHPVTLQASGQLGNAILNLLNNPKDAIPYLEQANNGLSALPDWKGKQPQVEAATKLAFAYCRDNDARGVPLLRKSVPHDLKLREKDPARTAELLTTVVREFLAAGEYTDGETYARKMIDARKQVVEGQKDQPDLWRVAADRGQLGAALVGLKKYDQAVDELTVAEKVLALEGAKRRQNLLDVYANLVKAETARGNATAAANWQAKRDLLAGK